MTKLWECVIFLLICGTLGLALASCGKRANRLDPPDDVPHDDFPYTYPDPATDPATQKNPPGSTNANPR